LGLVPLIYVVVVLSTSVLSGIASLTPLKKGA
jgi:hypothetical protein